MAWRRILRLCLPAAASFLVKLADRIVRIIAERDASKDAGETLPAVIPHELVKADMRTFVWNTELHEERLLRVLSQDQILQIDEQFAELQRAHPMEPALKAFNGMVGKSVLFQKAWVHISGRFKMQEQFLGRTATVFPDSTTVKAVFSRLGLERNEYRMFLTDLFFEGVLHSKQFHGLVLN